jgi:hypothetical protein
VSYIQPITALLTDAVAGSSLAVPTLSTDGISIAYWRQFKTPLSYDAATVYITAAAAATLGDATHPIDIYGYRNGSWWEAGHLDNAATIVFPATGLGACRRLSSIGIFDRLAVVCGTLGGTTYSYRFEPIALRFV